MISVKSIMQACNAWRAFVKRQQKRLQKVWRMCADGDSYPATAAYEATGWAAAATAA